MHGRVNGRAEQCGLDLNVMDRNIPYQESNG